MKDLPEFILASRSPRRRQLLAEAGYRFEAVVPPVTEPPPSAASTPCQLAEALAYFKARAVQKARPEKLILGADTVVACDGQVFGKPDGPADARRMLATLAGTPHSVITGLAVLLPTFVAHPDDPRSRLLASDVTRVFMRPLAPEELDAYIASGEWRDKAGAYAIQETADAFVDHIEGSFTNVVGLPMELLARLLDRAADNLAQRV